MEQIKNSIKHGNQVYKYFVSYLAVLIVPCLLAIVTYSIFFRDLNLQYDNALISGLTAVVDQIDDSIEKMHHYFYEISNNPLFGEYKTEKNSYNAFQLVKLLKVYSGSANYIQKYGFIDGSTDHIYTQDGGYRDSVFLKTLLTEEAAQEAEKDLLSDTILLKQYQGKTEEDIFIYMFPFNAFTIRNANEDGGFFIVLDKEAIIERIRPLINKDCIVTLSLGEAPDCGVVYSKEANQYTVFSGSNPFNIKVTTSSGSIDTRLAKNRLVFYIGMFAVIAISIILAMAMSRKHTKPIKRMLQELLPYRSDDIQPPRKNEFEELTNIVDDILDVRFLQSSKIDEQRNIIRQNALTLLLLGFSDDRNLSTLQMIGLNSSRGQYFAFLLYGKEEPDAVASSDKALRLLEKIALPADMEMSVVEIYHIKAIAGIVGYDGTQTNLRERLGRLLLDTTEKNGLYCSICMGSCVDSINDISRSYHEASLLDRNSEQLSVYTSSQTDLFFWDNSGSRAMADLLTILGNDDKSNLSGLVDKVLDEIDATTTSSLTKRCAYSSMIEALLAFSKHNKPDIVRYLQVDLNNLLTRDEFKSTVIDIATQYMRFPTLKNVIPSGDNMSARLVSYVAKNSCDADMSIELVMSRFKISANQVTNIFKTMTGYGFREYVILLRMQKAKELLLSTDEPVAGVAEQTGYRSTSYFIKTFKGYYGVTPIQYKKNSAQFVK